VGVLLQDQGALSIVDSKHNLSTTGPGPIRALEDTGLCIFCHTPHRARAATPLWNREDTRASYITYDSSTLQATPGQPFGASRLCLSCHDGSIALGALLSQPTEVQLEAGVRFLGPSTGSIGVNLRDDHPFSFVYRETSSRSSQYLHPSAIVPPVGLDHFGQVQCTSCHDPHSNLHGDFLLRTDRSGELCLSCHLPEGYGGSSHALSAATWNGAGPNPWPKAKYSSVQDNSCANCHQTHHAATQQRLLVFPTEEENCVRCHNGNVARFDVAALSALPSAHDSSNTTGLHDPAENLASMPEHVECVDCHDPHEANADEMTPPLVPGPRRGAPGVSGSNVLLNRATYGYEVCYRCHRSPVGQRKIVSRQVVQANVILEFDPANPSFHPVEVPGRNPDVPSLLQPWNPSSIMRCTDCHNSDRSPLFGGSGPDGPHGSIYRPLLGAQYRVDDFTIESPSAYALCYRCHSRASILGDQSFKEHRLHIVDARTPCSACHDPHGISSSQGSALNHSHLINFDLTIVQPDPATGLLEFQDEGMRRGSCTLSCHGVPHSPERY
jgi:predicted CXXCH cytochrome family protein